MKSYEYKIITLFHGSQINDWELNEMGKEGFRFVAELGLFNTTYNGDGTATVELSGKQLIMEKENEPSTGLVVAPKNKEI